MTDGAQVPIRLVFADRGSFHDVVIRLPADVLHGYERLIDALREEPEVLGRVYVDSDRLVAAYLEPEADAGG